MRGAQVMGAHAAKHFETSGILKTSIPVDWKTQRVASTNLETVIEVCKDTVLDKDILKKALRKLTVQDFESIFKVLKQRKQVDTLHELVIERLTNAHYTPEEIKHFLINIENNLASNHIVRRDSRIVSSPEELITLARGLSDENLHTRLNEMHRVLFDTDRSNSNPALAFTEYLSSNLFIDNGDRERDGIPVTEETFLKTLQVINTMEPLPQQ